MLSVCHSNETPYTDCKSAQYAQLKGTPTIPPSYTRVREVVWECGEGQTEMACPTVAQNALHEIVLKQKLN